MASRRAFLRLLTLTAASSVLDLDRLLWVSGRTTYFDIQQASTTPYLIHSPTLSEILATVWQDVIKTHPLDNVFHSKALLYSLEV